MDTFLAVRWIHGSYTMDTFLQTVEKDLDFDNDQKRDFLVVDIIMCYDFLNRVS
jgi:hypothetical protein